MEPNKILCKDVNEGLRELQKLNFSADIILADPPYNINKDFNICKDDKPITEYTEWCLSWINQCKSIMKDSATMYIYGFPEVLCHVAVKIDLPFRFLVWHYSNKTVPQAKFWQRSHEAIICCWKDTDKRIFNLNDIREPYTATFLQNAAGKTRKATKGRYSKGEIETTYIAHDKGAMPRDVIDVPALAGGAGKSERWFLCTKCSDVYKSCYKEEHKDHVIIEHPTQKPYKITEKLLTAAKPVIDGTVIIPFTGTGSECAVAEDLGLKYYGFEINPEYVFMANRFLIKRKLQNETRMDY